MLPVLPVPSSNIQFQLVIGNIGTGNISTLATFSPWRLCASSSLWEDTLEFTHFLKAKWDFTQKVVVLLFRPRGDYGIIHGAVPSSLVFFLHSVVYRKPAGRCRFFVSNARGNPSRLARN